MLASEGIHWREDGTLQVGDTVMSVMVDWEPAPGQLMLYKPPPMVDAYAPIIEEFRGANVVELGIYLGGSTAFFAAALRPRRLLAFELSTERVELLDGFLASNGFAESTCLHYGVDQADQEALAAAVGTDLDGEAIDLVIDDASHLYAPTIGSFEALFPRVRPGGLYVVEDWTPPHGFVRQFAAVAAGRRTPASDATEAAIAVELADPDTNASRYFAQWFVTSALDPSSVYHDAVVGWYAAIVEDDSPACVALRQFLRPLLEAGWDGRRPFATLTSLATELMVAMANDRAGIAEVTATPYWLAIRRSDEELDPATYRYHDATYDHFGLLERGRTAPD